MYKNCAVRYWCLIQIIVKTNYYYQFFGTICDSSRPLLFVNIQILAPVCAKTRKRINWIKKTSNVCSTESMHRWYRFACATNDSEYRVNKSTPINNKLFKFVISVLEEDLSIFFNGDMVDLLSVLHFFSFDWGLSFATNEINHCNRSTWSGSMRIVFALRSSSWKICVCESSFGRCWPKQSEWNEQPNPNDN